MKKGRSRRRRANRLALYGGTVILTAAVIGTAVLAAKMREGAGKEKSVVSAESITAEVADHVTDTVTAFEATTTAEGIDISGLSRSGAEALLIENMKGITVSWKDETVSADGAAGTVVSKLMDEIYGDGQAKAGVFYLDSDALDESFRSLAKTLAGKWNHAAVGSQLESFNRETGVYTYSEAEPGRVLDEEALAKNLSEAVKAGGRAEVKPVFKEIQPERTAAQAKEQYQVIGSFTTETTNNKNRNENIRLAVEAIDGRILKPGEEFSFNLSTGNRTTEKGYQPAGAYRNGVLIEEPGGGVCQVSTTLYNAIVNSGLQATERHSHSFRPGYIQAGQDAMVSFDGYAGPDLKFVNSAQTTVAVRASLKDNTLKISIVGLPVLEDGVKVTMRSEKVKDVNPPAAVYEVNEGLPAGSEKVVDQGQMGGVWKTFRVVTKDGNVLEETPLHNTTYRGKAPVIQKNDNPVAADGNTAANGQNETAAAEQPAAGQPAGDAGQESGSYETAAEGTEPQTQASEAGSPGTAGNETLTVPVFPGQGV